MKRYLKHVLCLTLSTILTTTTIIPSFASDLSSNYLIEELNNIDENISIVENNNNKTVVKEYKENETIVATYDKTRNIVINEIYNEDESYLISSSILDLNNIDNSFSNNLRLYQNTFSNREYRNTGGHWEIRSGNLKKSGYENDSNIDYLEKFRDAVEEVNSAEYTLMGVVGGSVIVSVVTALLSSGTAAAIAVAGGVAGSTTAIANLNKHINNADYYFSKVKFNK